MPFTPYHFGPSGLVALLFRKWLDVPIFILGNVFADIGYLFAVILTPLGLFEYYYKIYGLSHTFISGAITGLTWAVIMYLTRPILKWLMKFLRLPYQPNLPKMIISAVLGIWFHILIDGVYYGTFLRPLSNIFSHTWMDFFLAICFIAFVTYYIFIVKGGTENQQPEAQQGE